MSGDELRLMPDGTAEIDVGQYETGPQTWRLRRPRIGELREIALLWEAGAADVRAAIVQDGSGAWLPAILTPGKYAEAVHLAVTTLAGVEVEVDRLPAWCASGATVKALVDHWLAVPLAPGTPESSPPLPSSDVSEPIVPPAVSPVLEEGRPKPRMVRAAVSS